MMLRRFNEAGVSEFRAVLQQCRDGRTIATPLSILEDESLTETIPGNVEIPAAAYQSRRDLAGGLSDAVAHAGLSDPMTDAGLWAWLSAAHFDVVCPVNPDGSRKTGDDARHIPSASFRSYYRHLVQGPVRIYRLFFEDLESAMIMLCQKPSAPGDFVEQLSSRQERITSRAVVGTATALYYDAKNHRPKRGAAATERLPGTLRRYLDVLDQLALTWDLYSMSRDELMMLLPSEFEPWKGTAAATGR